MSHTYAPRPNLQTLHSDSSQLSEAIGRASSLAESVSGKVRILDLAKVSYYCIVLCVEDDNCLWPVMALLLRLFAKTLIVTLSVNNNIQL